MDMSKATQKIQHVQDAGAYGIAASAASVPLWIQEITTYGELVLLFLSITIAFATAIIQIRRVLKGSKE